MTEQIIEELFGSFDFSILSSSDFKEDSVREEIILPILHALGYSPSGLNQIIRSRSLLNPFVNIGSQKRRIFLIPDYLLAVEGKPAWILDAKAPDENIASGENVEQAYSYAIHPDVRVKYYALSNGREFTIFNISMVNPVLYFQV
ncbi:restriction endonuclease, partial [Chloroflexota bacterium]